jgi:hypothetical protein
LGTSIWTVVFFVSFHTPAHALQALSDKLKQLAAIAKKQKAKIGSLEAEIKEAR